MKNLFDEKTFEREAIRILDQIFQPYSTRSINYRIDSDVEYDAYYEGELIAHCVEITVSRKKEKASHDISKLDELIRRYNRIHLGKKVTRGWFVTLEPLSHDQREVLKKYSSSIRHIDYTELRSKLIDSISFLSARQNHSFGSFEPLRDSNRNEIYVDAPFKKINNNKSLVSSYNLYSSIIKNGKNKFIVIGEFGSGKSTFLKSVYDRLAKAHVRAEFIKFPIYLNLREFAELESPDEVFRRHARRIGHNDLGESLVRAWKAGYVVLIIDGFDEAVPRATARDVKRQRDLKRQALLVCTRLVSESPEGTPIVVSGRGSYFATRSELHAALGTDESWDILESTEFSDSQISEFMEKIGFDVALPNWLPRTPLLIWYYLSWLRENGVNIESEVTPEVGWLRLMERFCEREIKQIDTLPFITEDLLDLYGEIANTARKRESNIGPITLVDMVSAFRYLFKDEPTGVALGQLMRLPGLIENNSLQVVDHSVDNLLEGYGGSSKRFISSDFVDVAASRYLVKFFQNGNSDYVKNQVGIKHCIGSAGISTASHLVHKHDISAQAIMSSIAVINKVGSDIVAQVDVFSLINFLNLKYSGSTIRVKNLDLYELDLSDPDFDYSRVEIIDSYISRLYITSGYTLKTMPSIKNCCFECVYYDCTRESVISESIDSKVFSDCLVEDRDYALFNTNAYLRLDMDKSDAIMATILQKTYVQSQKGRMETALYSGVASADREIVDDILEKLEKSGVLRRERVGAQNRWRPSKEKMSVVLEYLRNPNEKKAKNAIYYSRKNQ